MKSDWAGKRYIGIDLKWDYEKRTLKTSMDGYVKEALLQFQHKMPKQTYSAPLKYNIPQYGAKQQLTQINTSVPMSKAQQKLLMQVAENFLYYARSIDDTMMHPLNNLATVVNDGTQVTVEVITYFLNYCASNQNATKLY